MYGISLYGASWERTINEVSFGYLIFSKTRSFNGLLGFKGNQVFCSDVLGFSRFREVLVNS